MACASVGKTTCFPKKNSKTVKYEARPVKYGPSLVLLAAFFQPFQMKYAAYASAAVMIAIL